MASRRDQLHSYQFMIQRVVAALVMRETDPAQSPFRRAAGAIFAGVMVAVIGVAGFMVYGLWKPGGNTGWIKAGMKKPVVLVVEETGAKYVFDKGTLYPALNYTSALLAAGAGGGNPQPVTVSRNSIAGYGFEMGHMIGIPGAPESLPSKDNLLVGGWSLCSQPKEDRTGAKHGLETVLVVGFAPQRTATLGSNSVLLVEDQETTTKYLVHRGHKLKIVDEELVLSALTWNTTPPLKVGAAWLSGLPEGQEIRKPEIPDEGKQSNALGGVEATVGEVFQVTGIAAHPYLVALEDGFAEITEMQAAIQMSSRGQEGPRKIAAASTGRPSRELWPGSKPGAPPESATPDLQEPDGERATCAVFGARPAAPSVQYNTDLGISPQQGARTEQRGEDGELLASRVVVQNGMGAIVYTYKKPGDSGGASQLCLVTDTGHYYVLPSAKELKMLGYDLEKDPELNAKLTRMPENVVNRLRRGPALDPSAALQPVSDGGA